MYIIAENIHIISPSVKAAIAERDAKFFQDLAVQMVDAGASAVDLNIGPQKKSGHEILPWLVETVEEVVDVPLVFDTTNLTAIEAACKTVTKAQPIINSTDARAERLETIADRHARRMSQALEQLHRLRRPQVNVKIARASNVNFGEQSVNGSPDTLASGGRKAASR